MNPTKDSLSFESLSPLAQQLALESLEWMEPYGDSDLNLLRYPSNSGKYAQFDAAKVRLHPVRESAWWAAGLLLRNRGDDAVRAGKVLEAVMAWQFDESGMPYHGTFHRAPEEPRPVGHAAEMWGHYDPNWRQFIGTTFLLILDLLPGRLSDDLSQRLESSVRLAVEGEGTDRVEAKYTNIAMMHAVLLVNAGARLGRMEWIDRGVDLAREIYTLFTAHGAFAEYNSPTYYGVDLYALRLWRQISPKPELVEWATQIEHALWRDIADYYHPLLRNLCGPFDRAYGMDMTYYASGIGLFLRLVLPPDRAPSPTTVGKIEHAHDFVYAPVAALLGVDIPDDARARLSEIVTKREIERVIEDRRIATAFLGPQWMWGGERGSTKCGNPQFYSATAHWQQPGGAVGWLRLENGMPVNVTATEMGLRLRAKTGAHPQSLIWHFSRPPEMSDSIWSLPGMNVKLSDKAVTWKALGSTLIYAMAPQTELDFEFKFEPTFTTTTSPGV